MGCCGSASYVSEPVRKVVAHGPKAACAREDACSWTLEKSRTEYRRRHKEEQIWSLRSVVDDFGLIHMIPHTLMRSCSTPASKFNSILIKHGAAQLHAWTFCRSAGLSGERSSRLRHACKVKALNREDADDDVVTPRALLRAKFCHLCLEGSACLEQRRLEKLVGRLPAVRSQLKVQSGIRSANNVGGGEACPDAIACHRQHVAFAQ